MTTPDPTLTTRLKALKLHHTDEYIREIQAAYRSGQLITLADAEAMVRAENEECALAVQSRSDFYAEKRKTAHDCDREMLMGDIIVAHDHMMELIRARVLP
jgi:hypothetical protein